MEEQCSPSPWPRSVIERDLAGETPYLYLGAWSPSKLLGFAVLTGKEKKAALANIAVHPLYRRRGIATQLLLGISEIALSMEYNRMILSVRIGNKGAMAFYKKSGFRLVRRERKYYSDGEDGLELEALLPLPLRE